MSDNDYHPNMGFSLSWLAVRGGTRDSVLGALGLRGTGIWVEAPKAEITGSELPRGWYMVVTSRGFPPFMEGPTLARLSAAAQVVTCFIEEHTMCSSADCWEAGRCSWRVLHDARRGLEHLAAC